MSNEITLDGVCKHEYLCSMSPMCASVISLHERIRGKTQNFKVMVESVLNDVAGNEEIANSLKSFFPGMKWARQVDIRKTPDDPNVMFKCFVFWDNDSSLWHVLVEGGLEDYWEKKNKHVSTSVEVN